MMGTQSAIEITVLKDCMGCRPFCGASRVLGGIVLRCWLLLKLCFSNRGATVRG